MPPRRKPQPSSAEMAARARTPKFRQELADQFGITPGADPPRETVQVERLPDPPRMVTAVASQQPTPPPLNLDEIVLNILREEMDELGVRMERFGVAFTPAMKQEMCDHAIAMLGGGFLVGGGALARR